MAFFAIGSSNEQAFQGLRSLHTVAQGYALSARHRQHGSPYLSLSPTLENSGYSLAKLVELEKGYGRNSFALGSLEIPVMAHVDSSLLPY